MSVATTPVVPRAKIDGLRLLGRYGSLVVLALLIIVVAVIEPETFATTANAINILNQSALTAIIAMGVTFPLVTGEFDLSVGYVASLAGVLACELMLHAGYPIAVASAVAVLAGALIGVINGAIVTLLGVHSLVATLGVGTVVVGVNFAIAGGVPVTLANPTAFVHVTLGTFAGIPYPVYLMIAAAAGLWTLLNRTVLGISMQAVGGNRVAAGLSGIRVSAVRMAGFVIAGVFAAAVGVLLASRTGSAAADGGDSYLLNAYAAAFFGSAVLRDGEFHIVGTLVGVLTVAVGFDAIALLGLGTYYQYLFQGGLLILGVGIGTLARRHVRTS